MMTISPAVQNNFVPDSKDVPTWVKLQELFTAKQKYPCDAVKV
jgi:hypothetical protein